MLVRVADHLRNARQGSDFFRSALGVAAGDHDLAAGILAVDAADGGARVLISGRSHAARINYHYFGLSRGLGWLKPAVAELAFDSRAVGLGGAAAEVLYIETGHVSILT
jgi:hypothetical protein